MPLIIISPPSFSYAPDRILISVDLPAPFSPTIACTSPYFNSKSISESTFTPEKLFEIFFIESTISFSIDMFTPANASILLDQDLKKKTCSYLIIYEKSAIFYKLL